jgi:putative transposase
MSRYRLQPAPEQESALLRHCSDARYIWNLAVEQHARWRPGRTSAPGYLEQSRQLTAARAADPWLAEGSQTVQQQALRDFDQAMRNFFAGTHRRPTWRKAGQHEGFRVVAVKPGDVRRLSRHRAEVKVPKAGWARFRWSRPVPGDVKSYRVTRDRAGRWHVAFAHIPHPVPAPGTGEVVGADRGVKVTAALSTGEMLSCPGLSAREQRRLVRPERRPAKARRGSNRRGKAKTSAARLKARETDRRKDRVEKTSTDLARRSGWGLPASGLEDKAPGRVEKVPAAYTSQRCSACGHVARENRESQAAFLCTACNFACNADVNAARNIAAGHAVKAREGDGISRPMNREPQLTPLAS